MSDILTKGVVAPDDCVKPKDAEKVKVTPNPDEFVLFVRKRNWRELSHVPSAISLSGERRAGDLGEDLPLAHHPESTAFDSSDS